MTDSVFISYSRRNQYVADRLRLDLERAGLRPWLDKRSIKADERWMDSIRTGIETCACFLYLCSPESSVSTYVQQECDYANQTGRRRIILRVAGRPDELPLSTNEWTHIDFVNSDYWDSLHKLLKELNAPRQDLETPEQLILQGLSAQEAVKILGDPLSRLWGITEKDSNSRSAPKRYLRIPLDVSGYALSSLVGEENQSIQFKDDLHVILKFSGGRARDTTREVLNFLCLSNQQPQILLLEGPINSSEQSGLDRNDYEIPNDLPHVWLDVVRLSVDSLLFLAAGKKLHFFFDSPQALIFPVAAQLTETSRYDVYNLNRNGSGADRYLHVYSSHPI